MFDAEAKELFEALRLPPFHTMSVEEARAVADAGGLGEGPALATVEDITVPGAAGGIEARLYRPTDESDLPLIVFFHGGGYVIGSLESHDILVRELALATGAAILAVHYRRAPEHPFPAPVNDGYAATVWVVEHAAELGADPRRVAVAGDSAGGNLSAVVCLRSRDEDGPDLVGQVLVYPVTAHVTDEPSMHENVDAPLLPVADVQWYQDLYLPDPADISNPYASPLLAESLDGLPRAVVVTAGHDPLRDQGDAYARRLAEARVPVEHLRYPELFHGFLSFAPILNSARAAFDEVAAATRRLLT